MRGVRARLRVFEITSECIYTSAHQAPILTTSNMTIPETKIYKYITHRYLYIFLLLANCEEISYLWILSVVVGTIVPGDDAIIARGASVDPFDGARGGCEGGREKTALVELPIGGN